MEPTTRNNPNLASAPKTNVHKYEELPYPLVNDSETIESSMQTNNK